MKRRRWSDRTTATAIAAVLHVVVLTAIGLTSPTFRPLVEAPPLEVVEVQLAPPQTVPVPAPVPKFKLRPMAAASPRVQPVQIPRPDRPATPAPPRPEPPKATPQPAPKPEPAPVATVQPPKPEDKPKAKEKEKEKEAEKERPRPLPAPIPAPPQPTALAADKPSPPPPPGTPAPSFRLPPGYGRTAEPGGGGLQGVLRATVGCEHQDYARLTDQERERCAKAFARDARTGAYVDGVPADKRAAYDVEAAANERRRARKEGSTAASPVEPCDGPGSNLGGGCLPEDAHVKVKN